MEKIIQAYREQLQATINKFTQPYKGKSNNTGGNRYIHTCLYGKIPLQAAIYRLTEEKSNYRWQEEFIQTKKKNSITGDNKFIQVSGKNLITVGNGSK